MAGKIEKWKMVSVIETVLLVEGDDASRRIMKFILEVNGYRVVEAVSGVEAMRVLEEKGNLIHLALCSPVLADMSAPEWQGQMRFLVPDLPVLILSERDWDETAGMWAGRLTGGLAGKSPAPTHLLEKVQARLDEGFFARFDHSSAA